MGRFAPLLCRVLSSFMRHRDHKCIFCRAADTEKWVRSRATLKSLIGEESPLYKSALADAGAPERIMSPPIIAAAAQQSSSATTAGKRSRIAHVDAVTWPPRFGNLAPDAVFGSELVCE